MLRRATCRTVRDLLPLHAGGDLPSDKAVLVDEHLHACLACFREFRDYAAMRGRLGVLAEEPLPARALDGFTDDVMARIALGEKGPAAALPVGPRWWTLPSAPLRVAAAAALLVASGAGLWQAGLLGPSRAAPANLPLASSAGTSQAEPPVARETLPVRQPPRSPALPAGQLDLAAPRVLIYQGPGGRRGDLVGRPGAGGAQEPLVEVGSAFGLPPGFDLLPEAEGQGLRPEPGRQLRPREP